MEIETSIKKVSKQREGWGQCRAENKELPSDFQGKFWGDPPLKQKTWTCKTLLLYGWTGSREPAVLCFLIIKTDVCYKIIIGKLSLTLKRSKQNTGNRLLRFDSLSNFSKY